MSPPCFGFSSAIGKSLYTMWFTLADEDFRSPALRCIEMYDGVFMLPLCPTPAAATHPRLSQGFTAGYPSLPMSRHLVFPNLYRCWPFFETVSCMFVRIFPNITLTHARSHGYTLCFWLNIPLPHLTTPLTILLFLVPSFPFLRVILFPASSHCDV